MNKLFIIVTSLLMSLFIVPHQVFAKVTPTPTAIPAPKVNEYPLPYPGILPDHPLYFLKTARDWLLDRLIADPGRKAEFYILQADKRLQMGALLIEKDKAQLGETTISKGEKYQAQAVQSLSAIDKAGNDVPGHLIDRVERSLLKHSETLASLIGKSSDPVKSGLTG